MTQPAVHGKALLAAFNRGHRPGRPVARLLATIYTCWFCDEMMTVDVDGVAKGLMVATRCRVRAERESDRSGRRRRGVRA